MESEGRRETAIRLRLEGLSRAEIAKAMGLKSTGGALSGWLQGIPASSDNRRPRAKDALHARAIELRMEGLSYAQIGERLDVSKSSLSLWLRDVPLREEHKEMLERRQAEGRTSSPKRQLALEQMRARRLQRRAHLMATAHADIESLSESELLIAGVVAYWAEGSKSKPWRPACRVQFTNSDARLIVLHLKWLALVGIPKEDLDFRVAIHETADVERAHQFWSEVVDVPRSNFRRPTIKKHKPKTNRKNVGDEYNGCLVVSVRRSTELYHRIEGWWEAILAGLPAAGTLGA